VKLSILSALTALLTGCGSSPRPVPVIVPDHPGTSLPLAYPILLLGQDVPTIIVFDSDEKLTTTTKASGFYYPDYLVIDSTGGLYKVKSSTPVGRVVSSWSDMVGNQPFRVFLEMKMVKHVDVEKARELVLEVVRNPRNDLSKPAYRPAAEAAVKSYRTLQELIAGCVSTNEWR
jgi:hypothetical protein